MQNNPYLASNFAPITDELDLENLQVVGEIPKDLCGIYMRNGPNPAFPPISYTYPYDGDGMIHAIYLRDGKASYSNRYVQTKGLIKERKAGKALYGGLFKILPIDPAWAGPEDEPFAIKNGAIINIVRLGNQYLALSEGAPAYQLTSKLETLGEWNPENNNKPLEVCAHTRRDPHTGDLWFINYSVMPPFLSLYRFDAQGKLGNKWEIHTNFPTMVHDFVLTENYIVIFDCPAVIDLAQLMKGGSILNWQPQLGTRIGVMSRQSGCIQWLQTDAFFVFHFANAYEQDNKIIIDYVRHEQLGMLTGDDRNLKTPPRLYRTVLSLEEGNMKHFALGEERIEFPRISDETNSLPHRFVYSLSKTHNIENSCAFNALVKYDLTTQEADSRDFGSFAEISEAVFAPSDNDCSEDDGYLMLFVYDNRSQQSEFVILDARNHTKEPLARIILPRRVPNGLHGSWMPDDSSS